MMNEKGRQIVRIFLRPSGAGRVERDSFHGFRSLALALPVATFLRPVGAGRGLGRHLAGADSFVCRRAALQLWPRLLGPLPARMNPGGQIYCESAAPLEIPAGWEVRKQGRAGHVCYQLLQQA